MIYEFVRIIYIASIVLSVLMVIHLRRSSNSVTLPLRSLFFCAATMFFSPLIAQAIYYYGLNNKLPKIAQTLNLIGFAVFIPSVVSFLLLSSIG